jgi:hypothetical protein
MEKSKDIVALGILRQDGGHEAAEAVAEAPWANRPFMFRYVSRKC